MGLRALFYMILGIDTIVTYVLCEFIQLWIDLFLIYTKQNRVFLMIERDKNICLSYTMGMFC